MNTDIRELNSTSLRKFAFTSAGFLAFGFGLVMPWLNGYTLPLWPWIIATVLILFGLLQPASLHPVYRGWMKVTLALGKVNTYLMLTVVFFFVVIPAGIVMRLVGYDPMERKFPAPARSCRKPSVAPSPNHMEKPF